MRLLVLKMSNFQMRKRIRRYVHSFKAIYNANRVSIMPNCYYHYVKRPGSLTDHMDIVQAYEMRAAYEYQELCLHQWFPNENFIMTSISIIVIW